MQEEAELGDLVEGLHPDVVINIRMEEGETYIVELYGDIVHVKEAQAPHGDVDIETAGLVMNNLKLIADHKPTLD